jgi:hypothetical protein
MDYLSTLDHLEKTFGPQDAYPEYQRALRELYIKLEILKKDPILNPVEKFVIDTLDREFSHILPSGNAIYRL